MKKAGALATEKYGYQRDADKFPFRFVPEADVVRDIYNRFAYEDLTILQICHRLKEDSIPIPTHSKLTKTLRKKPVDRASK